MIFYRIKNKLFSSIIKKTIYCLFSVVLATSFSAKAEIVLSVPIGSTGYLGEIAAPVSSAAIDSFQFYDTELFANTPVINYGGMVSQYGIGTLTYYPELDIVGIPMYNDITNNKKAFIVLVPSGSFTMTYVKYNGKSDTVSAVVNRGNVTSMKGLYNTGFTTSFKYNRLNWGLLPRSGQIYFFYKGGDKRSSIQANITGYSVYAIGALEPGSFSLAPHHTFHVRVSTSSGSIATTKPEFLNSSTQIKVNALKACDVVPQSMTTINYANQFSKNYPTPTKLAENIASVNVTCPYAGNVHLTLKPFNLLVEGSTTGMLLNGTKTQQSGNALPYVVTSLKSQSQSTICESNASEALNYVGTNKLGAMEKTFNQTLYFNLCANGNIVSDRYSGSVDVEFLIE